MLGIVGLAAWFVVSLGTLPVWGYAALLLGALLLGVLFVLPIGGADMPVVISLLNSFTGVAVAITGFEIDSKLLIICGALVGASGTILTVAMSRAMNRPLTNVLFGAFGSAGGTEVASAGGGPQQIRSASADDVAVMLAYASKVIFVPGYGMAVAQAQHSVKALADQLEKRGVKVRYAIHPVAGRMPGHMNVLLAEANVPYNQLLDMEDANPEFPTADVALVVGANDVTNPAARNVTSSPIYGMPILDVDRAGNVVVLKRSMRSGFRRHRKPALRNAQLLDAFRRRQSLGRRPHLRRQGPIVPASERLANTHSAPSPASTEVQACLSTNGCLPKASVRSGSCSAVAEAPCSPRLTPSSASDFSASQSPLA